MSPRALALRFAFQSASDSPWHMRQLRRSPRYTTNWNKLLKVGQAKGIIK
ncbi:DUF4113 domain-containing protein [Humidesulfovibrio sp.]